MARGFRFGGAGGGGGQATHEIKALIPTMTSNTTPSGVCFSSGAYSSSYPEWLAFDKNENNYFTTPDNVPGAYIGYSFTTPIVAKSITYKITNGFDLTTLITIKAQGSHDRATWVDLSDEIPFTSATQNGTIDLPNNKTAYSNYRILKTAGGRGMAVYEIQMYGYDPNFYPLIIYDHGSWNVGYDNPGGYIRSGWTITGGTLGTSKITLSAGSNANASVIGISSPINLSNYKTIHCLVKGINPIEGSSNVYGAISVTPTKSYADSIAAAQDVTSNVEYELALDISSLETNYYFALRAQSGSVFEIYKIWLT